MCVRGEEHFTTTAGNTEKKRTLVCFLSMNGNVHVKLEKGVDIFFNSGGFLT